jgi:hypothetical protein
MPGATNTLGTVLSGIRIRDAAADDQEEVGVGSLGDSS